MWVVTSAHFGKSERWGDGGSDMAYREGRRSVDRQLAQYWHVSSARMGELICGGRKGTAASAGDLGLTKRQEKSIRSDRLHARNGPPG